MHHLPTDELLKNLLLDCKKWIVRYHDHESLLENKIDEGLTEEDRKAAWEEYENERNNPYNHQNAFNIQMAQLAYEQRNVKLSFFLKHILLYFRYILTCFLMFIIDVDVGSKWH